MNEECLIRDKEMGVKVAKVPVAKHRMFLEINNVGSVNLITSGQKI